jgi:hypothetical protein
MLIRDPETGRAIVEPPEVRAARLAEASAARTERAERGAVSDKVWGAIGAAATSQAEAVVAAPAQQAPPEIVVQLPSGPEATVAAAAEIALSGAHVPQSA